MSHESAGDKDMQGKANPDVRALRHRRLLWASLAGLLAVLVCCVVLAKSAFADIALRMPPAGWPKQLALPPGTKLMNVTWLCGGACEPWTLIRPMRPGEEAQQYVFTNGRETIEVKESKILPQ